MATEDEDQQEVLVNSGVTESNRGNNTMSELPGRPFGITVEVPMFLAMLCMTLSSYSEMSISSACTIYGLPHLRIMIKVTPNWHQFIFAVWLTVPSSLILGTAINNIVLYRTCVHSLHHEKETCQGFLTPDKFNTSKQLEEEVQKYVMLVSTTKSLIESLTPAVLSFFLGVWSDTYGRKALIVWPLLGMALSSIMVVVYGMVDNYGPWWFIVTSIPYSLTGGFTVLFTGAFTYITDITSTNSRSLRMTLLEAMVTLGSILGGVTSSYLLRAVGNMYLLLIVAALNVFAYAYSNIRLKESLTGALKGGLFTVIDILLVKEMMRECFKKRANYGRAQILLLTFANSFSIFILYGLSSLDYFYTREKLHWSLKDFTIFSAASTSIFFFGILLGAGVVQKVLPVSDLIFSIIAFLSAIAEYLIKTFATLSWHLYLGAGVSLFKGLSAPLIRSFLTKILPLEDIAKVFSLMCALEGIYPIFAPAIYNSLYRETISSFPGAIYVLSAVLNLICVVMLGFVQYYRCKSSTPNYARLQ